MITPRKSEDRGHFDYGWLDTYHTFSFSEYYDPKFHGFRVLRVINEDRVQGREGFPSHSHRDMEIITYVLEGALEHRDSMGNGSIIRPGEVQRMSAGSGVTHSEYNALEKDPVHLLQIWIIPEKRGLEPSYEQKTFSTEEKKNRFRLIASPDGKEGSVTIHQDARLYAAVIEPRQVVELEHSPKRYGWFHVARGEVEVNGISLSAGDGAAVVEEGRLQISARGTSKVAEVLFFDLP